MKEIWKYIPSVPTLEASNIGRIRLAMKMSNTFPKGYVFVPSFKFEYLIIRHWTAGKRRQFFVHRLVAEAFYGPIPEGKIVAHKNGNSTDNQVENLYFATQQENINDREKHGRTMRGNSHYARTISEKDAEEIRKLLGKVNRPQIANMFKCKVHVIHDIARGKTWNAPKIIA